MQAATDKKTTTIAYYPGCSLHASSKFYDVQNKLVFPKLGIELKEIEDWNCCGATSASKTNEFLAAALPARNLGIADASGLSELLIPCSSCYSRLLVSQNILASNQELKAKINEELTNKVQGTIKIRSILEVLLPKLESGEIERAVTRKLEGLKPVCYYGCLLTRFPNDIAINDDLENPQSMEKICEALGAPALDWNYKTDCCGASATMNDADTALKLMAKIMNDAVARDANCFVTTCPMCQMNLDAYQSKVRERFGIKEVVPVYLLTELLGIAMGISPEALQLDSHFIDGIRLLKELRII